MRDNIVARAHFQICVYSAVVLGVRFLVLVFIHSRGQGLAREVAQLKGLADQGIGAKLIAKILSRTPQLIKQKAFWLNLSLAARESI
jgi:hypothetical protein